MDSSSSCTTFNVEEEVVVIRSGWTPKKNENVCHMDMLYMVIWIDYIMLVIYLYTYSYILFLTFCQLPYRKTLSNFIAWLITLMSNFVDEKENINARDRNLIKKRVVCIQKLSP